MQEENATHLNQLVAIYCRVSSERQEKEGTIQSQIAELESIAAQNGETIAQRYLDDGYSGELLERPALDKLRNDAAKRIFGKVYILSPDRLARKHHYAAIVLEDLARFGVQVIFSTRPVGESVEDRLLFDIQSVFADYEKAKILDRLRRGKIFKMKQGNVLGNVAPYGYRYAKEENTRKGWYKVDEHEAEIVRFIFSYYTSGDCTGMGGVRKELYRRNIQNRHGSNIWSQSMVARILGNETYIGTTHWGKYRCVERRPTAGGYRRMKNSARIKRSKTDWLPIKVTPIIDNNLFFKAQALKASNKQLSCSNVKYSYRLKGLMWCKECGSLMYSRSCHGTSYYVCSKQRKALPAHVEKCINGQHYRAAALDDAVWNEFRRIVLSPRVLLDRIRWKAGNRAAEAQNFKIQTDSFAKKISLLHEKRKKIVDAYTNGIIRMEELRSRTDEVDGQINELQLQQNTSIQENETHSDLPEEEELAMYTARIQAVIDKGDPSIEQIIVRNFIDRISLSRNEAVVSAMLPQSLSCVPLSTASLWHEQKSTAESPFFVDSLGNGSMVGLPDRGRGTTSERAGNYAFEFSVKVPPPVP
jgi:site-specific DNA recombinase